MEYSVQEDSAVAHKDVKILSFRHSHFFHTQNHIVSEG